ncbi:hypothetical protein B566_EDAN013696 [Ephemera danica]|nr:hypothetical protein B566_EDAN013696 [Ephemera danica]
MKNANVIRSTAHIDGRRRVFARERFAPAIGESTRSPRSPVSKMKLIPVQSCTCGSPTAISNIYRGDMFRMKYITRTYKKFNNHHAENRDTAEANNRDTAEANTLERNINI